MLVFLAVAVACGANGDALGAFGGRKVILGFRHEHVEIVGRVEDGRPGIVDLTLDVVEPMGNEIFIHARAGDHDVVIRVPPQELPEPGAPLAVRFDTVRLHFFDAESGHAIGDRSQMSGDHQPAIR